MEQKHTLLLKEWTKLSTLYWKTFCMVAFKSPSNCHLTSSSPLSVLSICCNLGVVMRLSVNVSILGHSFTINISNDVNLNSQFPYLQKLVRHFRVSSSIVIKLLNKISMSFSSFPSLVTISFMQSQWLTFMDLSWTKLLADEDVIKFLIHNALLPNTSSKSKIPREELIWSNHSRSLSSKALVSAELGLLQIQDPLSLKSTKPIPSAVILFPNVVLTTL